MRTAGTGPRVIVVFGPPASGVSTVIESLIRSSLSSVRSVPYLGANSISQIEDAAGTAEVVFVDVDGGLFNEDDIQALVDAGLIHAGSGALVRVYAEPEDCVARGESRSEAGWPYVSAPDVEAWNNDVVKTEARIRQHDIPYFMIPNHDLLEAVKTLALRSGLKS